MCGCQLLLISVLLHFLCWQSPHLTAQPILLTLKISSVSPWSCSLLSLSDQASTNRLEISQGTRAGSHWTGSPVRAQPLPSTNHASSGLHPAMATHSVWHTFWRILLKTQSVTFKDLPYFSSSLILYSRFQSGWIILPKSTSTPAAETREDRISGQALLATNEFSIKVSRPSSVGTH